MFLPMVEAQHSKFEPAARRATVSAQTPTRADERLALVGLIIVGLWDCFLLSGLSFFFSGTSLAISASPYKGPWLSPQKLHNRG